MVRLLDMAPLVLCLLIVELVDQGNMTFEDEHQKIVDINKIAMFGRMVMDGVV